ncbi:glutamate racemase [Ruminococcaceae bacterium OttesenSCG-928-O06]|nr:glutamate racemase [Ruminococcaceae bacterium OttesenSCG-928-O06]
MREKPIGVFDSGLGGLTAVRQLRALLPGEDIVYFGDTGRVPYGSRGRDIITAYAAQDIAFLLSCGVKTILAACGTVSSTFPQSRADALPVSYTGVVAPAAAAAAAATKNGRVGILGTQATIASGSYQAALAGIAPGIATVAAACPLFVPLVENGHFAKGDTMAALAAEEYLAPVRAAGVDTLILGCTHYPLLADTIAAYMGPDVALIDSGYTAAFALRDKLAAGGLLHPRATGGTCRYFVSDDEVRFDHLAHVFLGKAAEGEVRRINIEEYTLAP